MSAALDVDGVAVALGGAPVLRGVTLHVAAGTRTALVGPSGAGKTTLLRAVAGLTAADAGTITLGGRALHGVPAHRRRVAVVFQEPRLLPHLDAAENVALPLRAAGRGRDERRRRADALLDAVGLGGFGTRGVAGLSGGEQQRVAVARALCADPDLLLLDEPLAAVDPARREALRALLVRLQEERGVTLVLVTHDRAEAAELGQRIAVLLDGRIAQEGEPRALFERPATVAVARFLGMENLLSGTVRSGTLTVDASGAQVPVDGPDGAATVAIRPEHVVLEAGGPLRARVTETRYTGTAVTVRLDAGGLLLTATAVPGAAPAAGDVVGVALPPAHLWRIPGDGRTA